MELRINNQIFQSEEIRALRIMPKEVLIDGKDDFYRIQYRTPEEIHDAILYLRLQDLTFNDLYDAVKTIVTVCDVYINSKTQCDDCPLHKSYGCMLQTIPNNWI